MYDSPTVIGTFSETVKAGAFRETLESGADVMALWEHDPKALLGRRSSGTLVLRDEPYGLHFSLSVPNTTLGNDVLTMVERRDVTGASFGFRIRPGGEAWPAHNRRQLLALDLLEMTITANPAYAATSVAARARMSPDAEARLRRLLVAGL